MLSNFKKKFYEMEKHQDIEKLKIGPIESNTKYLNVIQTVTSGSFSGINSITGLKISYHLNEIAIIYRINLEAEAVYNNEKLGFWIPFFETKPIRSGIGSQLFQALLEIIKEIYEFLVNEGIKIEKLYLAGNLSSNDKWVGNREDSLPCYHHFAEKYNLDVEIKNCCDLNGKQIQKTYTDFLYFKENCISGDFRLIFTNSTIARILENNILQKSE